MTSSGPSSPISDLSTPPPESEMAVPELLLNDAHAVADTEADSSEIEDAKVEREVSPPHEEVLADNPDIAFIVMFRSRFSDAFPSKLMHFGPQDIEGGVVGDTPSQDVERLLCALLGLVLNRQKPIENGHYGRALEEAVQKNKSQWPRDWNGVNPLHGNRSFNTFSPVERLAFLRALIMWSLHESDTINAILKDAYKQSRQEGDLNVPLSVQPWGRDGQKRRYWLVEGKDDTPFRLYRENNPALKNATWWSVAGSIEDLQALVEKLSKDNTQVAGRLSTRIKNAIPRFEATEEKRRKREYRNARKAAFTRPEPGFSMYEGRTRGKRMRYTFDDDGMDDELSEDLGTRRSTRNSGAMTPAEAAPTTTLSGRQVRSRVGGLYGESLLSGQNTDRRPSPATDGDEPVRASRSGLSGISRRRVDADPDSSSEGSWDGGDEDEPDEPMPDFDDEEESADEGASESDDGEPKSLVVTLRVGKGRTPAANQLNPPMSTTPTSATKSSNPVVLVQNGYPTPSSSISGIPNGSKPAPAQAQPVTQISQLLVQPDKPTEHLSSSPPPNPYTNGSSQMKQSQLPFERMPQKPVTPQLQRSLPQHPSPQKQAYQSSAPFAVQQQPPQ